MNPGMRSVLLHRWSQSSNSLMLVLVFLIISSLVTSRKLTPKENAELKYICGERTQSKALRLTKLLSVGGRHAKSLEYPYMVGLTYANGFCSGVQISKRHILTAAHCVVNKWKGGIWTIKPAEEFTIFVGNKCGHPLLCYNEKATFKALGNPMPYEGYNRRYGDIAIIELNRDIPRSEGLPACMPERKESLGTHLTAVGYGWDPNENKPFPDRPFHWLQAVQLKFAYVDEMGGEILTSNRDESICDGDSGGPLIQVNKELKDLVVGISSKSYSCEERYRESASFFTDVRKKLDWICDRTGVCPTEEWTIW